MRQDYEDKYDDAQCKLHFGSEPIRSVSWTAADQLLFFNVCLRGVPLVDTAFAASDSAATSSMVKSTRVLILTLLAMIAFASNSLLCRAALKETSVDPASFTFLRIFSGAIALWLLMCVRRKASADGTPAIFSALLNQRPLARDGSWPSALALFVYAAAFSFAYLALSAGTGALLLFGAVQATMILWGLHKGERLSMIQIVGFFLAVTGLVVLVFPGLSAPPLASSILMLGAGVAWGIYSLRGKGERNAATATAGNFVPCGAIRDCSHRYFPSLDACRSSRNRLRYHIGRGYIRPGLRSLVQGTIRAESCERRDCSTQRPSASCHGWDPVTRRANHAALHARLCRCVRRNRARRSNCAFSTKLGQTLRNDKPSERRDEKRAGRNAA